MMNTTDTTRLRHLPARLLRARWGRFWLPGGPGGSRGAQGLPGAPSGCPAHSPIAHPPSTYCCGPPPTLPNGLQTYCAATLLHNRWN